MAAHPRNAIETMEQATLFPTAEAHAKAAALRRVERLVRAPLARREGLHLVPVTFAEACAFVAAHHRHHKPPTGHRFSIGAARGGQLVGVVIVGRPVARDSDDGVTAEVTRLCTDGTSNACSMLYGAAARAARAMGYTAIQTYILESEHGASLRASGWEEVRRTKGGSWDCPSRPRTDHAPVEPKTCFRKAL